MSARRKIEMSFSLKAAIGAAALVAGVIALPMSAMADNYGSNDNQIFVVGAIHDPANVSHVVDPRDAATPNMPVVYEDATASTQTQDVSTQHQAAQTATAPAQASAARTRSDLGHRVDRQ